VRIFRRFRRPMRECMNAIMREWKKRIKSRDTTKKRSVS
jgi:hypothetical protein